MSVDKVLSSFFLFKFEIVREKTQPGRDERVMEEGVKISVSIGKNLL